jgi:hypothetical protein
MKTLGWKNRVAAIIRKNLAWSPIPLAMKEQVITEALEAFENPPIVEAKKPETDEPLVRGEKLSVLREKAHTWGGWES